MLIHLNGMPGVGKLTVAQILADRLSSHLVDNHSIINAAYVPGHAHGSVGYLRTLRALNALLYQELTLPDAPKNLIFTNALANEYHEDLERFQAVFDLASQRGDAFIPILLWCDLDENLRRVVSPDRRLKKKLTKPDVLKTTHEKYTIIHPCDHPNQIRIDTTHNTPDQTAQIILDHVARFLTISPSHSSGCAVPHPPTMV